MRKITKNIIKIAGGLALAIFIYKTYKNEKKRTTAEWEEKKEEFSQLGIDINDEETYCHNVDKDPIVYRMYQLLLRSSNWDLDDFNSDFNIYGPGEGSSIKEIKEWECTGMNNTIHVLESNRGGKKMLHFYVQIPPCLKKTPLPSDYSNALKELVAEFWKNSLIDAQEPRVRYKGFCSFISNERVQDTDGSYGYPEVYQEIPDEVSSQYAEDGKFDGLSRMVSFFYRNDHENLDKTNYASVNQYATISFPIDEESDEGIDILQACSFLKKLIDTEIIPQKGIGRKQKLGPIIFHADGKLGTFYQPDLTKRMIMLSEEQDKD